MFKKSSWLAYVQVASGIASILLIIVGVSTIDSASTDMSRIFTNVPADPAMWMLVGGIVMFVTTLPVCLPFLSRLKETK